MAEGSEVGWKGVEGVRWLVEERRWKCVDEKGGGVWSGLVVLAHSLAKGGLNPWFSKGGLSSWFSKGGLSPWIWQRVD